MGRRKPGPIVIRCSRRRRAQEEGLMSHRKTEPNVIHCSHRRKVQEEGPR